jgi:hypothetical protein
MGILFKKYGFAFGEPFRIHLDFKIRTSPDRKQI